jgi:hypothetical protein
MGHSATTKAARQAARVVAVAAQEELARRTRANVQDLATYFSARQRADGVDDSLRERVEVLRAHAEARRAEYLRQCGAALLAMKQRGQSVRDVARMAGVAEKTARELIRAAQAAGEPPGGAALSAVEGPRVAGDGQAPASAPAPVAGPVAPPTG